MLESRDRIAAIQELSGRSISEGKLAVHPSREVRISAVESESVLSLRRGHAGVSNFLLCRTSSVKACDWVDLGEISGVSRVANSGDSGGLLIARSILRRGSIC